MWISSTLLLFHLACITTCLSQEIRADPAPIIYPGQVNIGLVSNVHGPATNDSDGCGPLRPEAVQRAMAAVWAAHQANFKKDDPQELNIGIYIFDTCGREDVAERQVYRLLGHVGHVQTTDCSEKRIPALFAVITEGDTDYLKIPLKFLHAFSVPVISTTGTPLPNTLSTAPSAEALARAAVSVLRHLNLLEVAVMAEDSPPLRLLQAFSSQAHISGMQAIQLDNDSSGHQDYDVMDTLKLLSQYGKSRLKAVVFLISSDKALQLLHSVDEQNTPLIPWLIVTPNDISTDILATFQRQQIRRLQKVLLLSPEFSDVPEFDDYFQQLLDEDTIKYHPLLMEFLQVVGNDTTTTSDPALFNNPSNGTYSPKSLPGVYPADVSGMVKAVWALSAALRTVQRRSCRRGTDCLLYLRRSLSAYVSRAVASVDHILDAGSSDSLKGTRLHFDEEGILTSTRYGLRGFTFRGDIKEVGFYSDDKGLNIDRHVLEFFTEPPSSEPASPITFSPKTDFKFKFKPDKVLPSPNPTISANVSEEKAFSKATKVTDFVEWKILEDTSVAEASTEKIESENNITTVPDPSLGIDNDIDLVVALRDEDHLQMLWNNNNASSGQAASMIGPAYASEHRAPPASSSSSNLRSISLTSHQEPRINDAYRDDSRARSQSVPASSTEDVKVIRPNRHVSAWLGRPWALSVLGVCGFLILATLYILVFLMVKACEGTLKKTNCCLAGTQLIALLCLYVSAALYTWKPSPLLCGLQRLMPNISLAFCYGGLLLKGMYLRAQNSLGLGGSVNRCNQMLTLFFMVGVQVALETQWWLVRPPSLYSGTFECTIGKTEILESQVYVAFLLLLAAAMAVSTRRIPYNQPESRSLIATTLSCMVIFFSWDIACWLLPDSASRNIAAPTSLIATALAILLGVFGPQLFAIHKYGGFPHKPLSYADSLSTVFTMFKDLDNSSSGGTTSRGKKNAKTLETPFAAEMAEGTRNPLYSDYQSAYP